jgi:hypothetical protein
LRSRPRRDPEGVLRPASPFFRLLVDENGLTDALLDFVIDPHASRNDRPVIQDLHDLAPGMVSVLEAMVLDGVEQRADVAAYVHAVLYRKQPRPAHHFNRAWAIVETDDDLANVDVRLDVLDGRGWAEANLARYTESVSSVLV